MTNARDLSAHLADLLRREHDALAEFLVALADFDAKRAWAELGYTSLFWFLVRELGLSKGSAYFRKTAAELVGRFPDVVAPIRDGRLCLTSVAALAKVITPENRADILPRFFHRSKEEAAEIVAELRPVAEPPRRAVVTAVRAAPAAVVSAAPVVNRTEASAPGGFLENLARANAPGELCGSSPQAEAAPAAVEPLTAELRRYHVTVSKRFLEKLEAARDALSHAKPGATPEEILEAGLDLLLERDAKRKGIVANPRKTPPPSTTQRIPAHVRRAVFERDDGRCQVPLASGEICGSTYRVQLGHIRPKARGGPPTEDNVRCECEVHNQRQADRDFGAEVMARIRRRGARTG